MPRQTPADIAIDPSSATPLYQQIAEAIRSLIESGELAPGDALAPLRDAAERWGVNLHTVRHAYTALSREGLIETHRGARGTRVAARARLARRDAATELNREIDRLIADATAQGVSASELLQRVEARLRAAGEDRPVVYVVECSAWQCEAHAREIAAAFDVDARAWPIDDGEPPADGAIVATYFHYNDIRGMWPHRLRDVHFVTITPRADLIEMCVQMGAERLVVIEEDEPTARNVAADVSALSGADRWEIDTLVASDAAEAVAALGEGEVALLAPRVWASLPEGAQASGAAVEVVYVLDGAELDALGASMQWSEV